MAMPNLSFERIGWSKTCIDAGSEGAAGGMLCYTCLSLGSRGMCAPSGLGPNGLHPEDGGASRVLRVSRAPRLRRSPFILLGLVMLGPARMALAQVSLARGVGSATLCLVACWLVIDSRF